MFESLFGRNANPSSEDFANGLLSIAFDADLHGHFYNLLKLTAPERKRYVFSTFLFTTTLPMTLASSMGRSDWVTFIPKAYAQMLNSWQSKDAFVRLGDFVITEYERIRLPEILLRLFKERVGVEDIQEHRIRIGYLLDASAMIRGDQQVQDIRAVAESRPPSQQVENLFGLLGVRLSQYIYTKESIAVLSGPQTVELNAVFQSLAKQLYERTLVALLDFTKRTVPKGK